MVAQLLSRAYSFTGALRSLGLELHWSFPVELLHYLASLFGISVFCSDALNLLGPLMILYLRLAPLLWPWRSGLQTSLSPLEDIRRKPLRSAGKFVVLLLLNLGVPLMLIGLLICCFTWVAYNPHSDDFAQFSSNLVLTNVS